MLENRRCNVVLDVEPGMRLGQQDGLAQLPHAARLLNVLRHGGVVGQVLHQGFFEHGLQAGLRRRGARAAGQLDQHRPRRCAQRRRGTSGSCSPGANMDSAFITSKPVSPSMQPLPCKRSSAEASGQ